MSLSHLSQRVGLVFKLYQVLDQVNENVLYFDTDSVIFLEKKNEPCPVKTGAYLGELTNELKPGNCIFCFWWTKELRLQRE